MFSGSQRSTLIDCIFCYFSQPPGSLCDVIIVGEKWNLSRLSGVFRVFKADKGSGCTKTAITIIPTKPWEASCSVVTLIFGSVSLASHHGYYETLGPTASWRLFTSRALPRCIRGTSRGRLVAAEGLLTHHRFSVTNATSSLLKAVPGCTSRATPSDAPCPPSLAGGGRPLPGRPLHSPHLTPGLDLML